MANEMDTPRMGIPARLARSMNMAEQHEYLTRNRTSRRTILRGGAVVAGAAIAAPLLGAAGSAAAATPQVLIKKATRNGAYVVPFARHLAFGADPRTEMSIGWQVALPVQSPFVRIGRNPLQLGQKIAAEIRPLHSEVPGAARAVDQYYVHAELSRADPGHDLLLRGRPQRLRPCLRRQCRLDPHLHHRAASGIGRHRLHVHRVRRSGRELRRPGQRRGSARTGSGLPPACR